MKNKFFLCVALSIVLCVTGCGGAGALSQTYEAMDSNTTVLTDSAAGSWESGLKAESASEIINEAPEIVPDKQNESTYQSELKIIKTGSIEIESADFDKTDKYLQEKVTDYQGIIAERSIHGRPGYRSASYLIRIPSASFDDFFYAIDGACTVINQQISSEDVTERYVDLETRLETNEKKYKRLLTLLDKAETLTDVYSIQNEISNVEYEINSIKGTVNSLSSKVAYSTISIWVEELNTTTVTDDGSFVGAMKASFMNGWNNFLSNVQDMLIVLAYTLPGLILFSLVVFVFIVAVRKVYKKIKVKRTAISQHTEEAGNDKNNKLNCKKK